MKPILYGRSGSHFTRVARIFAAELGVAYDFRVVRDLLSLEKADYGDNPALKLPTLVTDEGHWFGALNICRVLARAATKPRQIVWPEALTEPLAANAQELVLHAMATAVSLIMGKIAAKAAGTTNGAGNPHETKLRTSLEGSLAWLEENARGALATLPAERELSYLEVTLYCLVTYLEFRAVVPVTSYRELVAWATAFGARASAQTTTFRLDS